MSFQRRLQDYIEQYTNFKIIFMNDDGSKTRRYLDIPYYSGNGKGKNTPKQIKSYILEANENWDGDNLKSSSKLQKFVDKKENKPYTGIDYSGLAYYVLNEASEDGKVKKQFGASYGCGVLAKELANKDNGRLITKAKDIVPGCTMRTDNGNHVIVVYAVVKNSDGVVTKIRYAHSNSSKGPHKAYIKIEDENQDLDGSSQTWEDSSYTDRKAKEYYNYTILLSSLE